MYINEKVLLQKFSILHFKNQSKIKIIYLKNKKIKNKIQDQLKIRKRN